MTISAFVLQPNACIVSGRKVDFSDISKEGLPHLLPGRPSDCDGVNTPKNSLSPRMKDRVF